MTSPRATTRFCGSMSLHYVTVTSPLCRDPKLISNNMAAVLAVLDGLTLVCSASSRVEVPAYAAGQPAADHLSVDIRRETD